MFVRACVRVCLFGGGARVCACVCVCVFVCLCVFVHAIVSLLQLLVCLFGLFVCLRVRACL